jgi:predicted lipoprotein with Yx(FWY)xxD motif
LVAVLGVVAVEACSDDEGPSYPATGGGGGKAQGGGGGHSGGAGHAGTGANAGATHENAGQAGESTNDAGAAGAAGSSEAGTAGVTNGGSAGTLTGGTGGVGGTLPSGGAGGTAGVAGTLPSGGAGGTAGVAGTPSGGTAGAGGASSTFTLQTTTLGQVIGTANGLSLYVFKTDTAATATAPPVSSCTSAGCLAAWPIYYSTPVSLPLGLLASDFGSFDRGAGVLQSTYKGWPLYRYAPDTAVGDVKGEGANGKWYAVRLPFPGFSLQTTTLGPVIATAAGFSLYVLTTDTPATATAAPVSTCTSAGCLGAWPIYYGNPVSAPLGLLASDFGSFDRGGGVWQSTYKGWPLYTFVSDATVGAVSGEGIQSKWYTAKSPFVLP